MNNPEPIYLLPAEIEQITGYQQPARQLRWLTDNGLMHKKRADGTPLVARSHFNKVMGGFDPSAQEKPNTEPDFSNLSA